MSQQTKGISYMLWVIFVGLPILANGVYKNTVKHHTQMYIPITIGAAQPYWTYAG
jgi:hypothetical protein